MSAVYNLVNSGTAPPANDIDAAFNDDVIEFYGYDERWRLVSVWKQNVAGPKKQGGEIANRRYQVNDGAYCEQGGTVPKPTE